MSDNPRGCRRVDDVIGNGRKKLLLISKSGDGRSSLCNVIAGLEHDSAFFCVSENPELSSHAINFGEVLFAGDVQRPITVMNAHGLHDHRSGFEDDGKLFSDIVAMLRAHCDYVNLFAIAVNGQQLDGQHQVDLDDSVSGMISIFEEMFGQDKFWNNAVIIFTHVAMDDRNRRIRLRATKHTDDEIFAEYLKFVEAKFPNSKGVKYLHVDSCYDEENRKEREFFDEAMAELWDMLKNAPKIETMLIKSFETEQSLLSRVAEFEKHLAEVLGGLEQKGQHQKMGTPRSYGDNKAQLQKEYEMIIQQKQRELDELKKNFETAKKEQQAVFEYEVKEMTARVRLSETRAIEQGKSVCKKAIQENHEKQIKALEDKLQVGVHKVEKDTKLLTANYESQLDKWISHKKDDGSKDGWRVKAFGNFDITGGSVTVKSDATVKALQAQYPDSHWVVFVIYQKSAGVIGAFTMERTDGWCDVSKNGEQAMEKKFEDIAYGTEDHEIEENKTSSTVVAQGKPQTVPLTLYIWRVLKTHCKELRQASADERKEVAGIVQNLKELEKKGIKWSNKRWRDKLASQMDQKSLAWKHVLVANEIQYSSKYHSLFLLSGNAKAYICFSP